MQQEGRDNDILGLARDLLDDIELARLTPERLLLKATRLARLLKDDEKQKWLSYELRGYSADEIGLRYMDVTGRWTDRNTQQGYWQGLATIDTQIATMEAEIGQLRVPDIQFSPRSANPQELVTGFAGLNVTTATAPIKQILDRLSVLRTLIATLSSIRGRVLELLHGFISRTYYELLFSTQQANIFESYRTTVDAQLAESCGDVLQKFPAVYDRLAHADAEAISQALNTCRRIIDAFADSIFPPSSVPLQIGGKSVELGPQHHQNRILAFVEQNCDSRSRKARLRRVLIDLYDRISAGVHNDVTPSEARSLSFQTYLLMGEILELRAQPTAHVSHDATTVEVIISGVRADEPANEP